MERLENSRWGFESNCFVCEAANPAGLGVEFFADTDDDAVVADFSLDQRFSGAPSYVHGGVVLAVLDEAMAWATFVPLGPAQAVEATGATVTGDDARYVRDAERIEG